MLINIHVIQNHSPANLNRDDLGAPKTCFFGGVLRSRISSQCLKRSIRMSDEFISLLGGVRTRRLAKLIAERIGNPAMEKRAEKILQVCGFPKDTKKKKAEDEPADSGDSKAMVYTTRGAIDEMVNLLRNGDDVKDDDLAKQFAELIANRTAVPDMALSGRMLEPDKAGARAWKGYESTVEAALQVAHAISTHEARPEVDYFVAADDIPGEDAGAAHLGETMFSSACFYKYFSIHWEVLVKNLENYGHNHEKLAAHTTGAFIRGAALANPTGKQNSFGAHNPPDGILIEIRDFPISYANAFADPVRTGERDITSQSVAQLVQYVIDLDTGYGRPHHRYWFSPNLRYPIESQVTDDTFGSLDELINAVIDALGYQWEDVKNIALKQEVVK